MRAMAPDLDVDSAGTSDWHAGDPPHAPAIRAAARRGYDLSALRARQVRASDFETFDMILAMNDRNLEDLERLRPKGSRAVLRLFLDFAPGAGTRSVPDPYYTSDFDGTLDLIEQAAVGLIESL